MEMGALYKLFKNAYNFTTFAYNLTGKQTQSGAKERVSKQNKR